MNIFPKGEMSVCPKCKGAFGTHSPLCIEYDALRAKLDKAMEGLRVYANKNNWAPSVNMPQRHFISNQNGYDPAARVLAELEQE